MLLEKLQAAGGGGGGADTRGALMSALNRGSDVTSGLRKVTADMKTKNQKDRSGVPPHPAARAFHADMPPCPAYFARRCHMEPLANPCLSSASRFPLRASCVTVPARRVCKPCRRLAYDRAHQIARLQRCPLRPT